MKKMDEEIKFKNFSSNQLFWICLVFGILFLCVASYQTGYNRGYTYVKNWYEEYNLKWCECWEPEIFTQNKIIPNINFTKIKEKNQD